MVFKFCYLTEKSHKQKHAFAEMKYDNGFFCRLANEREWAPLQIAAIANGRKVFYQGIDTEAMKSYATRQAKYKSIDPRSLDFAEC